ncbi:MAG: FAD-binding dehydrogenase [Alphaproteobacteria bacterium HGW-Alphaproteobacteria-13]|jgi:tricarballylate dehydrogenase|nr:MAG: FAD-binding dehydrogenase [Alphaproteobacteria bacterium HGW-Alphaproteobacteria-13]
MEKLNCDVLVVGCGAAGLTAALSAVEAGASVIVLERSGPEDRGGNTRWTEALLRLRARSDDGQPFTVTDDFVPGYASQPGYHIEPDYVSESARPYEEWGSILRTLPYLDPEVLGAFVDGIPEAITWLEGHGLKFERADYPFIFPAPLYQIYGGGEALVETLAPIVEAKGARILYHMTAIELVRDDEMGVAGVRAVHSKSGGVEIRARATILACGGFEGNPAMKVQYLGPSARFTRPVAAGGWYNKGEGIRLALDLGAAPSGDFAECHRQPVDPRSSASEALIGAYPFGIVVNSEGRRFMDEAPIDPILYLEEHCRRINAQPGGIGYFIADARIDEIPAWQRMIRSDQPAIEAGSLDELAGLLGIPADNLAETVAQFNAACPDEGGFSYARDDDAAIAAFMRGDLFDWGAVFDKLATSGIEPGKSNWARPLDRGPYRAYPIISTVTFTCGGLKTTRNGEVVRTSGALIPGLYAAGETMGIMYGTYIGATSVLRGITFGRITGRHAAAAPALG